MTRNESTMIGRIRDPGGGLRFVLLLILAVITSVAAESNCHFDTEDETLRCQFESLVTNVSLASSSHASHLEVSCNNALSESLLRSNHFGYLPNLRSLSIEDCSLRRVPGSAFMGLSGLTSLEILSDLDPAHSMVLDKESLSGLNGLRSLNLSGNHIITMPKIFCALASLTSLNLSSNFLQDVEELGFSANEVASCSLPISTLDLSGNSFSRLAAKAFGQLRKIEILDLSYNNLNVLDDLALDGLVSLRSLNLAHNELVAIPADLFSVTRCCLHLQELQLQNNSLSGLGPDVLEGLEHLLVLNLSRNEIGNEWLSGDTFSSLVRLVALDLSHNRLTSLDSNLLTSLTSLQYLDLSHNKLRMVPGDVFLSQYNLHMLKLSFNQISSLHSRAFNGLSVLGSLAIDHNVLGDIGDEVMENCCSGLSEVFLNHNNFHHVPIEALKKLPRLKSLDLGENRLSTLDRSSFEGLKSIYALRLAGNSIRSVKPELFETIASLRVLNLADNLLVKLDHGVFNAMNKLRMLRLDNNQIEDFNGILAGQTELKWLNVSSNKLLWFDYGFIPRGLEFLDISHNKIEELGNYYNIIDGFFLTKMDASHNRIKQIDQDSVPKSVRILDLSENRIRVIEPGTFRDKPELFRVDLRQNSLKQLQLSSLSIELKDKKAAPSSFLLSGNPFLCNCEMEWLLKINDMSHPRQYPRVQDFNDIECHLLDRLNTSNLITKPISSGQVEQEDFLCQYKSHCFALCKCCSFVACDCSMQCPAGCDCFHDSAWTENVIQCSSRGHRIIPHLIPMDATSVYMDGNNFTGILSSQAFIGRKKVRELFLNHSRIEAVSNQTFNGLSDLELLHLDHNAISRLEGHEFGNLTSLKILHLEHNKLVFIHEITFSFLRALEVLHLEGNQLVSHPIWDFRLTAPSVNTLYLSDNPWSCKCDFVNQFQQFASKTEESDMVVADFAKVQCFTEETRVNLSANITCSDALAITLNDDNEDNRNVIKDGFVLILALVSGLAIVLMGTCLAVTVFVFRTPIRVWLHSKYGLRVLDAASSKHNKLYDAFVSYSTKDEDFVQQVLLPTLEQNHMSCYKLCLQHRDLPKSSSIADTFPGVATLCARHMIVVSRAYLESDWKEISYAFENCSKKLNPVIILLDELSTLELASAPEYNLMAKSAPIIRWNDPGFWNKVRFHLPDPKHRAFRKTMTDNMTMASNVNNTFAMTSAATIGAPNNNKSSWQQQYDNILNNSSSNTTTGVTSSVHESPRTLSQGSHSSSSSQSGQSTETTQHIASLMSTPIRGGHLVTNPMRPPMVEHTYQSVVEPIYHTLEPSSVPAQQHQQQGFYDTLGKVDVMLPNGQFVPATLVRNHNSGQLIPVVNVSSASNTLPPNSSGADLVFSAASPKTPSRNNKRRRRRNPSEKRHFV